jgi:carbon monoxide dehydrogenase subunit G
MHARRFDTQQRTRTHAGAIAATLTAAALASHAGAQTSWLAPTDGSWFTPTNWDSMLVPGSMDDVVLGLSGPYTVSIDNSSADAGTLSITNPDALLGVGVFRRLSLFGDVFNNGEIVVNTTGSGSAAFLTAQAPVTFSGAGSVRLNSNVGAARLDAGSASVVTNGADHTLRGRGSILAELVNNGLISADVDGGTIQLTSNPMVNNSTMEAINGAELEINAIGVTQGPGAMIVADGAGSIIDLFSAAIDGGELMAINGGLIEVRNGTATLRDVELTGPMDILVFRQVFAENTLTNNGVITVNSTGSGSAAFLTANTDLSLDGSGEVVLASTTAAALLTSATDATLTQAATHTIRGRGGIRAELVNNGLVSSDAGGTILLSTNPMINNATMEAVGGSELEINGIGVTQGPGAMIAADGAGSVVDLLNATVDGGDLMAINGGLIEVRSGNATLRDVELTGPMDILVFRQVVAESTLVNNGVITVNPTGSGSAAFFTVGTDIALDGSGEIVLASSTVAALITAPSAEEQVTNTPSHTIRGRGGVRVALVNDGLVSADDPAGALQLTTNNMANNATMQAVNGAELEINGVTVAQSNDGVIIADGPGTLIDLVNATIDGGELTATNGGLIEARFGVAVLNDVHLTGPLDVRVFRQLQLGGSLTNDGLITVNPSASGSGAFVTLNDSMTIDGTGEIRLVSNNVGAVINTGVNAALTLGPDQTLSGRGSVQVATTLEGTLAPGLVDSNNGVGTMFSTNTMNFTPGTVFEADVAGEATNASDTFSTTGVLELEGTLRVTFVDGFAPSGPWVTRVVTGGTINGKFAAVETPTPPGNLVARTFNTGSEVRVGWTCPPDFDLSGGTDILDVVNFITAWNTGDPETDFNNDGNLNILDVVSFITVWNAGCV